MCLASQIAFNMGHAIRRINKEAPWNVFQHITNRAFEPNVDIWELLKLAQHMMFNLTSIVQQKRCLPMKMTAQELSNALKEVLHTTNCMELNFHLIEKCYIAFSRDAFGEMPCPIIRMMPHVDNLLQGIPNEEWSAISKMNKLLIHNADGTIRNRTVKLNSIKLKDPRDNITRIIYEFRVTKLFNPLASKTIERIFHTNDFDGDLETDQVHFKNFYNQRIT